MSKIKADIFRIIDANLNRSREGLRVCEDIARFALDSKTLTEELKTVRHRISDIAKSSAAEFKGRLEARNSEGDILRRSRFESEMKRRGLAVTSVRSIHNINFAYLLGGGIGSNCGRHDKIVTNRDRRRGN